MHRQELTYYVYMARVTPLDVLRRVVRANFEAKEYPNSMRRLFAWTPDEAIPEFFTDARIFTSRHRAASAATADDGNNDSKASSSSSSSSSSSTEQQQQQQQQPHPSLPDMKLPAWCASAEELVSYHAEMLESRHVSKHLHHWIDLNFGWLLSTQTATRPASAAAVAAMNVALPRASQQPPPALAGGRLLHNGPGFTKLFRLPHPPRARAALPPHFARERVLAAVARARSAVSRAQRRLTRAGRGQRRALREANAGRRGGCRGGGGRGDVEQCGVGQRRTGAEGRCEGGGRRGDDG